MHNAVGNVERPKRKKRYTFTKLYTTELMDLIDGTEDVKTTPRHKGLINRLGFDEDNLPNDLPNELCVSRNTSNMKTKNGT